ncbi:LexA family protein [Sphingomonas sp. ID0503]|uniref:LexA family protein n=1 Tax=Sphingomonas sp. ID0503 TaxID=3399691 RepID=UPI003AFA4B6E
MGATYPIIVSCSQGKTYDLRICDNLKLGFDRGMDLIEIKAAIKRAGLRQIDIAEHLGLTQKKVSETLGGKRRFQFHEMDRLRELLAKHDPAMPGPLRAIPIIGQVAAGNWREAVRHPLASMPALDPSIPHRAFALRVAGDSMDLRAQDGATIVVDPEDRSLYPGRLYVVLNEDGETTFKEFRSDPARLVPLSSNPAHVDIVLGQGHFEVVGRVIWIASRA